MKSTSAQSKTASKPASDFSQLPCPSDEERVSRIALSAYFKAEARGFEAGHEMEDWLTAEAEEK